MACNIIQLGRIRTKFNLHISVYKSQILKSKSFSETLLGGCAVCTRQTSIKWISFFRPLCINYSSQASSMWPVFLLKSLEVLTQIFFPPARPIFWPWGKKNVCPLPKVHLENWKLGLCCILVMVQIQYVLFPIPCQAWCASELNWTETIMQDRRTGLILGWDQCLTLKNNNIRKKGAM